MNFLYRTEDIKLINSVKPLPYIREDGKLARHKMAEIFFQLKHNDETLGLVEVDTKSVVGQISEYVNHRSNDEFEFLRIADWEKNFARSYTQEEWTDLLNSSPFADSVAKVFWLCDHLRNQGKIEFPITQAWNKYYNAWEVTVGNARLAPLRLFYNASTISVIRFKTEQCQETINWVKVFDNLSSIEDYYGHASIINYRAWAGSLIPSVHFYNKNRNDKTKLEYQNRLAKYFNYYGGLRLNSKKSLYWNINKILDEINVLA